MSRLKRPIPSVCNHCATIDLDSHVNPDKHLLHDHEILGQPENVIKVDRALECAWRSVQTPRDLILARNTTQRLETFWKAVGTGHVGPQGPSVLSLRVTVTREPVIPAAMWQQPTRLKRGILKPGGEATGARVRRRCCGGHRASRGTVLRVYGEERLAVPLLPHDLGPVDEST